MTPIGIGIWGAGWVAGEHVRAFSKHPGSDVVAIGSRTKESAHACAEAGGLKGARIHTSLDALLADPNVDAVSLCTPPHLHAEEAIQCAQAGKHILIEKAVANDILSLRSMRAAVKESGVRTVVSFVLRWNPEFQWIARMLHEQAIGPIFYAEVDYWHNIGPQYKQFAWNVKRDIAGSVWLSAGCHAVDALCLFAGSRVLEVTAYSNRRNPAYEYDTNAVGIVRFENGAIGKVSASFDVQCPYAFNIDLLGERGAIRDNHIYAKDFFGGQTDWISVPTIRPDSGDVAHHPFDGEIAHFVHCVTEGQESFVSLDAAAHVHEVCYALERSATEGRAVKIEEL